MVREGVVLFGIEHLQQRRAGIAAEVVANLVHLVHHEHGVDGAGFLHALNNLTRQRASIRTPMTANRRFIVHTAQRHAHELTPQRSRNALAERSFAHTWWPKQTQDGTPLVFLKLTDGEIFDDALLDLLETVVILVEYLTHLGDVHVVFGRFVPRQIENQSK